VFSSVKAFRKTLGLRHKHTGEQNLNPLTPCKKFNFTVGMLRNSCIIPQHAFPLQASKQKFRGSQEFQTVEFPLKSKKKCAVSGTTSLFNNEKSTLLGAFSKLQK
jgi:hypothetical protein